MTDFRNRATDAERLERNRRFWETEDKRPVRPTHPASPTANGVSFTRGPDFLTPPENRP